MSILWISAAVVILSLTQTTLCQGPKDVYERFLYTYGTNSSVSPAQLSAFLKQITSNNSVYIHASQARLAALNGSCPSCIFTCESLDDILKPYGLAARGRLSSSDIQKILPALFARIQNPYCYQAAVKEKKPKKSPWSPAAWGYGFLMVSIINGCALLGFSFSPFIGRHYYKLIMTFMVALAVGSLCGSALLFLLPDALRMAELEELAPNHGSFIWKVTVVMGGIYLFFLLERVLKWMIEWKDRNNLTETNTCSMNLRRVPDIDPALKEMPQHLEELASEAGEGHEDASGRRRTTSRHSRTTATSEKSPMDGGNASLVTPDDHCAVTLMNGKETKSLKKNLVNIAPVAWMIIVGDGVHNFIDGLSIGAAFSHNTITGFSLSMAVLCEELPHELGDFAILLNSGMTVKQAMLFNFASACMCYLGLVIGIVIGELTESAVWIFSIAAGMFLYISLVDMMPEVNHMMESEDAKRIGRKKIFLLQNLGFIVGYGMLLLLALFGDQIKF